MLRPVCYLFEAKGIQRYIFASGRLRDVVAASDLVASLASSDGDDLLTDCLKTCGLTHEGAEARARFSRRAGGSFCIHVTSADEASRLRALWRLTVGLTCPGLEYVDAIAQAGSDLEALDSAYSQLGAIRDNGAAALLPAGNSLTMFNPRTGRLAVAWQRHGSEADLLDTVSAAQRRYGASGAARDRVTERFKPEDMIAVFPVRLDGDSEDDDAANPAFPFDAFSSDRRMALVHADLSGLGEIFKGAKVPGNGRSAETVFELAKSIEGIVVGAAQAATQAIFGAEVARLGADGDAVVLPARPVLLGGDDITILIRADAAVPWAALFLREIENRSARDLAALRNKSASAEADPHGHMPGRLSACAGVAVMKYTSPFLQLSRLAEDLCKAAKGVAKSGDNEAPYPSLLTFHVNQSTLYESYDAIVRRELTPLAASADLPEVRLTGGPYFVGGGTAHAPALDHVLALSHALDQAPRGRGKWIEASQLLFGAAPQRALDVIERWRTVLGSRDEAELIEIERALKPFGVDLATLPETLDADGRRQISAMFGPVMDALELIDIDALDYAPQTDGKSAA